MEKWNSQCEHGQTIKQTRGLCLCFFCLVFAMPFTHLFICALWSLVGNRLTSWLSFVVSYCGFVTFPLVSWVRCGT